MLYTRNTNVTYVRLRWTIFGRVGGDMYACT